MLHNKILMTNDGQDVSYRVADDKDCTLPDETGNLIYGNVDIWQGCDIWQRSTNFDEK